MTFEDVNRQDKIPKRNEESYKKRNVFKYIVKTWLESKSTCWFDTENIYNALKSDLIRKLNCENTIQKQEFLCEYTF